MWGQFPNARKVSGRETCDMAWASRPGLMVQACMLRQTPRAPIGHITPRARDQLNAQISKRRAATT
eukprot:6171514-Amphidinium_carterae.1